MAPERLDEIDRKILAALQKAGRMPNTELADAVGLSPSQSLRRVRRIEGLGVVRGYVALLNREAVGLEVAAFIRVTLEKHDPKLAEGFERSIQKIPEVLECYALTGEADYLLRVVAPTVKGYSDILMNKLRGLPGVTSLNTSVVLMEIKQTTALPLDYLPGTQRRLSSARVSS